MNILARAMIDVGKEVSRLKDELSSEKYYREASDKEAKQYKEISEQRQLKILGLTTQFAAAKEEIEKLKVAIDKLSGELKKIKTSKKSKI